MSFCLHECLRAVGLQDHYARFTSVGVCRAAHLSVLTMEDYPILGIRSMEDRTRLFQLIQMVKTLDLESLEQDSDDNVYSDDEAGKSVTYDDFADPLKKTHHDEERSYSALSKRNTDSFYKPSFVCRRLDYSGENCSQKLFYRMIYDEPGQDKGLNTAMQLDCKTNSAPVCNGKGSNDHRQDARLPQRGPHMGVNNKPDITEGSSLCDSHIRFPPQCISLPRPAAVSSKKVNNKPGGHRDSEGSSRMEKPSTDISCSRASEHMRPTPVYVSKGTAEYNYGLPLSSSSSPMRKRSHGQRISVCVRKRPQTHTERRRGEADVVTTPSRDCVIVHECKESVDLTQYILQHRFYFDQVFGEECSNEEVYQGTAYPLVQHMLNGGRATCFAYGQTGSGKTFTMLGSSPTRPGLYALAIRDIFAHLSSTHTNSPLLVYVSLFEIYCGQLYDLLDHRKRLYAREDGQKVVHIAGLRDVRVDSVSSLLEVIAQGTEERTQGVSGVNPHSSRSHALLQIQLKDRNQRVSGRMWFVDLAGSERASDTKDPDRQSRMEGAEINQSLLALKECIRSLDQEQSHTPFRQSKLTQVLKDSFVGDSMTCMIANISPGHLATEHTLNTLRYADRVKELKGQRGERRGKTVSYQSSMSKSSRTGGVNIRGKSPKKPKLGRQREAFVPTSSSTRHTGGPVLCSTPKNTRNSKKTSTRDRKDISLEQISPIRGSLGTGDKRKRAGRKEGRGREIYVETDRVGHSGGDQNASGSWSYHHHRALQEDREEERRLITERGPTQSSRYSCTGAESVKEGDLGEDKEKEMHLRRYHQQLQQFTPSSASSSLHLLSPSIPSSNPASLSSSVSPSSCSSLLHASHLSDSVLTYQGLKEVLDAVGAKVKVRTEACLHTKIKDEEGCGDSSGGDVRSSREAWRPAGMENIAERGWAWVTATEAEQTGGMTGVKPAALEAQMSYSRDSEQRKEVREEGLESSDVPTEGMWSNEEHESNEGSSSFTHPIVESYSHQAPAERPLSPGCEHTQTSLTSHELMELPFRFRRTSNNLHLTSQNSLMDAPTRRHSEKEHWFAANGDTREFSNAGLPQEDSVSHTMDPLSISLLEVDQQAATASFLQGGLITGPLYPLENETKEENRREVEKENRACLDMTVKAGLGTMKLSTPEVMPESLYDQDNQKPQLGLAINILGNKTYASTPSSGSLIKQTSANIQSISSSVQPCWKTGSPNPPKRKMNGATQTTPQTAQQMHNEFPPSVSISPAGSVLGLSRTLPKQGHTVPSIPSNNSNISLQPTIWRESNFQGGTSNQKTPNMINLPMLEDTDHAKWRVIQAHWEQLEEMEALWHKEGALLCQQPDMVFSEYVHKLEEIMTKKAKCVNNMIAQLRPYLGPCYSNQAQKHNKEDNHDAT